MTFPTVFQEELDAIWGVTDDLHRRRLTRLAQEWRHNRFTSKARAKALHLDAPYLPELVVDLSRLDDAIRRAPGLGADVAASPVAAQAKRSLQDAVIAAHAGRSGSLSPAQRLALRLPFHVATGS
jgi:hypothetical protein